MRQKLLYTRTTSEISGLFSLEKRRVFKENTSPTPENSPENFSEKDVLWNLSFLKDTLKAQKISTLKAKISGEKISLSRDELKEKMRIDAVKDIISKNIKTLSASRLMMAEEIFPGLLKKMFIKEDGKVNFQGNSKAEQVLGLGDMLPLEKTHIVVFDARSGKYEYGVRGIKNTSLGPRPAYINMETGKYIEILQNYEVLETVGYASPIPQPSEKKFQAVKNGLNPHEAIFDTKVLNKKGKKLNTKEDIAKNKKAQEKWTQEVSTIETKPKKALLSLLSKAKGKEDGSNIFAQMSGNDFFDVSVSLGYPDLIKKIKEMGLDKKIISGNAVKLSLQKNITLEGVNFPKHEKDEIYSTLYAVLKHENSGENFKQFAISKSHAIGVAQILPSNIKILKKNPFNLDDNINMAVKIFLENYTRAKKNRENNPLDIAIKSYFAGYTAATKKSNTIPQNNKETPQEYLGSVLEKKEDLSGNWDKITQDFQKKYVSSSKEIAEEGLLYTLGKNQGARNEKIDISGLSPKRANIVKTAMQMVYAKDRRNSIIQERGEASRGFSCWEWANEVYQRAGVKRKTVFQTKPYKAIGSQRAPEAGDWLYIHNGNGIDQRGDHSVIFLGYANDGSMMTASFPGSGSPRFKNYTASIRHISEPA